MARLTDEALTEWEALAASYAAEVSHGAHCPGGAQRARSCTCGVDRSHREERWLLAGAAGPLIAALRASRAEVAAANANTDRWMRTSNRWEGIADRAIIQARNERDAERARAERYRALLVRTHHLIGLLYGHGMPLTGNSRAKIDEGGGRRALIADIAKALAEGDR